MFALEFFAVAAAPERAPVTTRSPSARSPDTAVQLPSLRPTVTGTRIGTCPGSFDSGRIHTTWTPLPFCDAEPFAFDVDPALFESPEPVLGGKPAIMRVLENRMMVNELRSIDAKSFTVKKTGDDTFELAVDYEQRQHLFFNIDTVLTFKYAVTVKGR